MDQVTFAHWLSDAIGRYDGTAPNDDAIHAYKVVPGGKAASICGLALQVTDTGPVNSLNGHKLCPTCYSHRGRDRSTAPTAPTQKSQSRACIMQTDQDTLEYYWYDAQAVAHDTVHFDGPAFDAVCEVAAKLVERSRTLKSLPLTILTRDVSGQDVLAANDLPIAATPLHYALRNGDVTLAAEPAGLAGIRQRVQKRSKTTPTPTPPPTTPALPASPPAKPTLTPKRALKLLDEHQLDDSIVMKTKGIATILLDCGAPPDIVSAYILSGVPDNAAATILADYPEVYAPARELRAQRVREPGYKPTPLTQLVGRARTYEKVRFLLRRGRGATIDWPRADEFMFDLTGWQDLPPSLQPVHTAIVHAYRALREQAHLAGATA